MTARSAVVILALALTQTVFFAQGKPVLVVQPFKTAPDVALPYDMGMLQTQLVAEFKVMLGQDLEIVPASPESPSGKVYSLEGDITGWRAGNAAKRFLVGMGSGREALDLLYRVKEGDRQVFERKDTIRTNFYSQGAGSTGTLAHPIAQKVADRIKDARLR
jgi:hypothetical protein